MLTLKEPSLPISLPALDDLHSQIEQQLAQKTQQRATGREGTFWTPLPGPQELAYHSTADELFYGGAAGGGKTDLGLGLAGTAHWRSIIFRRVFPSMRGMIERSREIFNAEDAIHSKDSYNESLHVWRLLSGRIIEFGSMQYEKDKGDYKGRPHDLKVWDELPEFTESQYRFVNAWNRTTIPGQRVRIVATGNPPIDAAGEWVIKYWSPWLDNQHPNPALPSELRWFAVLDGKDEEVEDGTPFTFKGELIQPKSRTFIPAHVQDNPYYMATGYLATLQAQLEPLRSQLLYGDFTVGTQDDPWQCISTAWVLDAQNRRRDISKPDVIMRAAGVDVARGGKDNTAIAPLYGTYFDDLLIYPGSATPDGMTTARYVTDAVPIETDIWIDVIGYGASAYDHLCALPNVRVHPVNNSGKSTARDKTGRYEFANIRAESYWKLREALDPQSGENIVLPLDRRVRVDLCAVRFKIIGGKIALESKEDVIKRTGVSPDYGDAIVLAWYGAVNRLSPPFSLDIQW